MATFPKLAERSTEFHFDTFDKQIANLQEAVTAMNSRREPSTEEENTTKSLRCGDVYVTKHSNLANYQVVFHLVSAGEVRARCYFVPVASHHPPAASVVF
jgi:hypothetical protein